MNSSGQMVPEISCIVSVSEPMSSKSASFPLCTSQRVRVRDTLLMHRCAKQVATFSSELSCRQATPHETARMQTLTYQPLHSRTRTESVHLRMFVRLHATCGLRLLVCMSDWAHVCYQDASPQLSHSFPAASRGWKREKPQTSGAPQPIRIVYLASHGRLAEQEHAASHTALLSLSLSFSTTLNSFWLHLLSCVFLPDALLLKLLLSCSQIQFFSGYPRGPRLIIMINKMRILWFVCSVVSLFA